MSNVVILTKEQVLAMIDEEHHVTVLKWVDRGDGIAVYQNAALDSSGGHKQFVSFGSKAAQLETDDPPARLSDIGGAMNWKYRLVGTYRERVSESGPINV